jgi:hypothetical protein
MRLPRLPLALLLATLAAAPLLAQEARKSPHETVGAVIGERHSGVRVTITYGRPYTKDPETGAPRKIWGGLVPWEQSYRLGADEATLLLVQQPLTIGDTTVPAGAYTLYMIPSATGPSQLAISRNVGGWGVPVEETHDVARVELKKSLLDQPVDQLTIGFENASATGATLAIKWETTEFSVALKPAVVPLDIPQASPAAKLTQRLGVTDIEVSYSRPSARGRHMLGGNNPYGTVWRTGANNATRVSFSTPVTVEGAPVEAGAYELFTIPGADEWTVILQKAKGQWGAYAYDPKDDTLRVKVKPVTLTEPVETFTIEFGDFKADAATLELSWERTLVPVHLGVDVVSAMVPRIEAAMARAGRKPYYAAAIFYADHGLDLDKATGWINAAIAQDPGQYSLFYQKARILAKKGDKAGALAAANESIALANKDTGPGKDEYLRLNQAVIAGLQ